MNNFEKSAKNVFLLFVACSLFALPVFVYMNLVPVVDSSLSQNSLTNQDISNKERNYDEIVEQTAQVVKKEVDEQQVLGVLSDSSFGVEPFYDSSIIINEENLINEDKAYFSVITLESSLSGSSNMFDVYLINENPKYKGIVLEFGLMEDDFMGLVVYATINDKKYLIYDGNKLTKSRLIKEDSNHILVLGFEIEGESLSPENEKNISIKLDRL